MEDLSLLVGSCKLTIRNPDGKPFGTCTGPGLSLLAANWRTIRRRIIHGKDASFSVISTGPSRARTDMSESVAPWHLGLLVSARRFLSEIVPPLRQLKKAMIRLQSRPLHVHCFLILVTEDWTRRHLFIDVLMHRFGFNGTLIIG